MDHFIVTNDIKFKYGDIDHLVNALGGVMLTSGVEAEPAMSPPGNIVRKQREGPAAP